MAQQEHIGSLSICLCVALFFTGAANGHATDLWLAENARLSLDNSARSTSDLEGGAWRGVYALGLDYHKIISGRDGDIGTLIVQPYWIRLANADQAPFFFDSPDDTTLTWRITNFNYTALSRGKFNIRVGHFEVPFGLEQNIDTNGTLRQYSFSDRGIKVDWGITANGILPRFEYEFAWSRGSGNEYLSRDGSRLISGRIGTSQSNNTILGLSYFDGNVLNGAEATPRTRYAIDAAHYWRQWEFLLEASTGHDDAAGAHGVLGEISWRSAMERLHGYVQMDMRNTAINQVRRTAIGGQWLVSPKLTLDTQISKTQNASPNLPDGFQLSIQLRYRVSP